ncbi:hypothetical protein [Ferroplasma acidiphilum]|uniref:hypothetical protein n=1 Tax=Ferroplasma acidiphilum TaxID=74969 RepID=UPI0028153C8C|nr:hypothetical protein [Ferroplasma acidiphilum]WMT53512.1 MAG: hypothetical protein RE473_01365 [Ferroplasma acidiphilum]
MTASNSMDWIIQRFSGVSVDAIKLALEARIPIEESEDLLRRWMSRHPDDYFILSDSPLNIKITTVPHDINVFNHNMHEKNLKKYRKWER